MIDEDYDKKVTWEELYNFDISKALTMYPDVFLNKNSEHSDISKDGLDTLQVVLEESDLHQKSLDSKCSSDNDDSDECEKVDTLHEEEKWTNEAKIVERQEL